MIHYPYEHTTTYIRRLGNTYQLPSRGVAAGSEGARRTEKMQTDKGRRDAIAYLDDASRAGILFERDGGESEGRRAGRHIERGNIQATESIRRMAALDGGGAVKETGGDSVAIRWAASSQAGRRHNCQRTREHRKRMAHSLFTATETASV